MKSEITEEYRQVMCQ